MHINLDELDVLNNPEALRFEVHVGDQLALIDYKRRKKTIYYIHTEVPPSLEGQGIAGKMARTALDYARDNNLTVVPLCPFVRAYIEKHPDYQSLVREDFK